MAIKKKLKRAIANTTGASTTPNKVGKTVRKVKSTLKKNAAKKAAAKRLKKK